MKIEKYHIIKIIVLPSKLTMKHDLQSNSL